METTWVEKFFQFLEVEKSASPNTVSAYRTDLAQFASAVSGHRRSWSQISQTDAGLFIQGLETSGYKDASITRKVSAIKSFFQFLASEGLVNPYPMEELNSPHVKKVLPRTLSPEELARLLDQPSACKTTEGQRNQMMVRLLSSTGLRVSELVSLDVADVTVESDPVMVRCRSKTDRERILPLDTTTGAAIAHYIVMVRPLLIHGRRETALFLSRRGERLTRQGFWLILKNYAREAKVYSVSPHTLRHTYATRMLSAGKSLREIQEAMGHAYVATTAAYQELVPT